MAHVQIRSGDNGAPSLSIVVDGVDISQNVYTEGFGLVRVGDGEFQQWGLSLIVPVESLDLDLPDAVVSALSQSDARARAIKADS